MNLSDKQLVRLKENADSAFAFDALTAQWLIQALLDSRQREKEAKAVLADLLNNEACSCATKLCPRCQVSYDIAAEFCLAFDKRQEPQSEPLELMSDDMWDAAKRQAEEKAK